MNYCSIITKRKIKALILIQNTINYLLVLFAFVFPISLGGANGVFGLILLLWLIEGNFQKKLQVFKEEKILWIFLAIGLLTMFSALLSDSSSHSFLAGEKKSLFRVVFSHYILIPFIAIIVVTSMKKDFLDKMIHAFLLAILFSEVISYLIFFQLIDTQMLRSSGLIYFNASIHDPTPFMHHTEYSVFLSVAVILLLNKLFHTPHKYLKLFIMLFLTSATINLFINGGRTGQLAFLISTSVYVLFYFKVNLKTILAILLVLSSILILAYKFSPTFHHRSNLALQDIKHIAQGNYNTSWGVRAASTKVVLGYLLSSPKHFILGAGVGDTKQEYHAYAQEHFDKNISEPIKILAHLHNQYLQYWMDGSIFSLLLFLLFLLLLLRLDIEQKYKASLYAFVAIVAFSSTTDIPLFRYQPAMLFYLMTGYLLVLSQRERQQ